MNLYLAAMYTNGYRAGGTERGRYAKLNAAERACVDAVPNLLESYHYVSGQRFVDAMRMDGAKVFLDSGAFSAKSLGVEIDLNGYCDYIKRNDDIIRRDGDIALYSVLDGIGDPLKTWQNQMAMEAQGVRPLPCFHFGEDDRYLEWYVDRYEYITLGGMAHSADNVMQWLDRIWNSYLLDGSGRPRCKVHAFGVTTISLMERYPWHSVDSSSWIQAAAFGSIFTAEHGPICVSSKSPSRHDYGRHLQTLTDIEREYVLRLVAEDGFTQERLAEVYEARAAYNCRGYTKLNAILNEHFKRCDGILDCHAVQYLY